MTSLGASRVGQEVIRSRCATPATWRYSGKDDRGDRLPIDA